MTTEGFPLWALLIIKLLTVPDPTGRTIIWAWELIGNFFKSRLTKYLVRMHGAMATSGTIDEKNIGNQVQNYIELHGHGPEMILVDRPHDDKPVNWKVFEDVKAEPGEKALLTFHTIAFEGSIGLVNMLQAKRRDVVHEP